MEMWIEMFDVKLPGVLAAYVHVNSILKIKEIGDYYIALLLWNYTYLETRNDDVMFLFK